MGFRGLGFRVQGLGQAGLRRHSAAEWLDEIGVGQKDGVGSVLFKKIS